MFTVTILNFEMAAKLIDSEKPEDEIDLTDGQIQQLLLEAEMRMGPPETKSSELLTTNSASADKAKSESALLKYLSILLHAELEKRLMCS